ncbi:hypothetical protein V8F20_011982 [Naviculisporaceae sp. PSN 640]
MPRPLPDPIPPHLLDFLTLEDSTDPSLFALPTNEDIDPVLPFAHPYVPNASLHRVTLHPRNAPIPAAPPYLETLFPHQFIGLHAPFETWFRSIYARVSNHRILDQSHRLLSQDPYTAYRQLGPDNSNYLMTVYLHLHNGLVLLRRSKPLHAPQLYHWTRRALTYLQDKFPQEGLGQVQFGRWFIAPDVHNFVVNNHDSSNTEEINVTAPQYTLSHPAICDRFDSNITNLQGPYRIFDHREFLSGRISIHFIDLTGQETWGFILRHAATNKAWLFAPIKGYSHVAAEKIRQAFNSWLVASNLGEHIIEPHLWHLWHNKYTPPLAKGREWTSALHVIAHLMVFVRFGMFGWGTVNNFRAAAPPSTEYAALEDGEEEDEEADEDQKSWQRHSRKMCAAMMECLHRLLGLTLSAETPPEGEPILPAVPPEEEESEEEKSEEEESEEEESTGETSEEEGSTGETSEEEESAEETSEEGKSEKDKTEEGESEEEESGEESSEEEESDGEDAGEKTSKDEEAEEKESKVKHKVQGLMGLARELQARLDHERWSLERREYEFMRRYRSWKTRKRAEMEEKRAQEQFADEYTRYFAQMDSVNDWFEDRELAILQAEHLEFKAARRIRRERLKLEKQIGLRNEKGAWLGNAGKEARKASLKRPAKEAGLDDAGVEGQNKQQKTEHQEGGEEVEPKDSQWEEYDPAEYWWFDDNNLDSTDDEGPVDAPYTWAMPLEDYEKWKLHERCTTKYGGDIQKALRFTELIMKKKRERAEGVNIIGGKDEEEDCDWDNPNAKAAASKSKAPFTWKPWAETNDPDKYKLKGKGSKLAVQDTKDKAAAIKVEKEITAVDSAKQTDWETDHPGEVKKSGSESDTTSEGGSSSNSGSPSTSASNSPVSKKSAGYKSEIAAVLTFGMEEKQPKPEKEKKQQGNYQDSSEHQNPKDGDYNDEDYLPDLTASTASSSPGKTFSVPDSDDEESPKEEGKTFSVPESSDENESPNEEGKAIFVPKSDEDSDDEEDESPEEGGKSFSASESDEDDDEDESSTQEDEDGDTMMADAPKGDDEDDDEGEDSDSDGDPTYTPSTGSSNSEEDAEDLEHGGGELKSPKEQKQAQSQSEGGGPGGADGNESQSEEGGKSENEGQPVQSETSDIDGDEQEDEDVGIEEEDEEEEEKDENDENGANEVESSHVTKTSPVDISLDDVDWGSYELHDLS